MDNSKDCSTKKCITANCVISVLAVFVFTFFYDWLVHGKMLVPLYNQTPAVWRPMEQMQAMFPWCLAFHFFMALVVTCMFKKYKKYSAACDTGDVRNCSSVSRGVCFGTHIGLIFGLGMFSSYIWLPVSLQLGALWFATGMLKGFGVGVILGILGKGRDEA